MNLFFLCCDIKSVRGIMEGSKKCKSQSQINHSLPINIMILSIYKDLIWISSSCVATKAWQSRMTVYILLCSVTSRPVIIHASKTRKIQPKAILRRFCLFTWNLNILYCTVKYSFLEFFCRISLYITSTTWYICLVFSKYTICLLYTAMYNAQTVKQ